MNNTQVVYLFPSKALTTQSLTILICIILFVYSLFSLSKIIRIFKFQDIIMIMNTLCVALNFACYGIAMSFFISNMLMRYRDQNISELSELLRFMYLPVLSVTSIFTFFAFQFDIYKWLIFIVGASSLNTKQFSFDQSLKCELQMLRRTKILKY